MSEVTDTDDMKAVVIHIKDDGDLYRQEFLSVVAAREWLDGNQWKAILVIGDNLATEDHT